MRGEEERCLAAGMDAYLAKPVAIDRLRVTLERWLPIGDGAQAASSAGIGVAIDRDVLAAWLGDDRAGIEDLLRKFRDSAVESEQAINAAWRAADLAALGELDGIAQQVEQDLPDAGRIADQRIVRAGLDLGPDRQALGIRLWPQCVDGTRHQP